MKNEAVHAAIANTITPTAVVTAASDGEQPSEESIKNSDHVTVFLLQFVTGEDISDPLEFQEVLKNIDELFSPFGNLCSIDIKLLSAFNKVIDSSLQTRKYDEGLKNVTLSNDGAGVCDLKAEVEEAFDTGELVVIVTFHDSSAARSAVAAINGEWPRSHLR